MSGTRGKDDPRKKERKMKIKELEAKIAELKQKADITEDEKKTLSGLEQDLTTENQGLTRYQELSAKDEESLTSTEVDEFLQLGEKFADEKAEPPAVGPDDKKYAGKYDTVEGLIEGWKSSEEERKRIESDPNSVRAIEDSYKDSQRRVTKLVADRKAPPKADISRVPLVQRELHEMTREEYDSWEKQDKLAAHAWLSNATRKESLVQESRLKVLKKYKGWLVEINGIDEPSKELLEWDRLDKEHPELKSNPNWPELIMGMMEDNLGIKKEAPRLKVAPIKPDFAQGKVGGGKPFGKKKLTEAEYEALPEAEKEIYWAEQVPA